MTVGREREGRRNQMFQIRFVTFYVFYSFSLRDVKSLTFYKVSCHALDKSYHKLFFNYVYNLAEHSRLSLAVHHASRFISWLRAINLAAVSTSYLCWIIT